MNKTKVNKTKEVLEILLYIKFKEKLREVLIINQLNQNKFKSKTALIN